MDTHIMKLALCFCLFITLPRNTEQNAFLVINTILGIGYDVAKLTGLVDKAMDKVFGIRSDTVTTKDLDKAVESISRNIEAAKTEILNSIALQFKFNRIDDAVFNIRSSLIDLKTFLEMNDSTSRDELQRLYILRFENNHIETHVRFLPEVLTYEAPGMSGQLLSLLTEKTSCNLTALSEFQDFYLDILSSGIALETAYLKLTTQNQTQQKSLEYWQQPCDKIQEDFDKVVNKCTAKFVTYANEDIVDATSPTDLWVRNNKWYPWKSNDVFFSKTRKTFKFVYELHEGDSTIWKTVRQENRFSVFYDTLQENNTLSFDTLAHETDIEQLLRNAIQGENDENAAEHIGLTAINILSVLKYGVESLLVIFENGDFAEQISPDSPALKAELKGIKMKDGKKKVVGTFHVYAYIYKKGDDNSTRQPQHVGCGDSLKMAPLVILLYVCAAAFCVSKVFL